MNIVNSLITLTSYGLQPKKRALIRQAYNLKGKVGLEIGGPTSFFGSRGGFPVYLFAGRVDGVNFSSETVWEGEIRQGNNYHCSKGKTGYQFITEATNLEQIQDNSYDFLLSSHCLEHIANPIKALKEWCRVLKAGGDFILLLPDKENTFDHKRNYTPFEHILTDYLHDTPEDDTTHFAEILNTVDEEKSNLSYTDWEAMLSENRVKRCAHHHVFSFETVRRILEYTGFNVRAQCKVYPFHLVTSATKKK